MEGKIIRYPVQTYMTCPYPKDFERRKHNIQILDKWECPCGCLWVWDVREQLRPIHSRYSSYDERYSVTQWWLVKGCNNSLCTKDTTPTDKRYNTISCAEAIKAANGE